MARERQAGVFELLNIDYQIREIFPYSTYGYCPYTCIYS